MTDTNPAINYEKYFVPAIGAPLAKDLIRHAALHSGERVLDVACGTGVVARLASEEIGADGMIVGVDVNPAMLEAARSAVPPDKPIEWCEASAENMPLPDASFDVVTCQMGLQFMPDRHGALREIRRVLAPGGRLILNVPGPTPPVMAIMEEGLGHHIGTEAAGFAHQVFSLHDTDEIQKLVEDAGFQEVAVTAATHSLPLPPPKEFLWQYIQSTPLIGVVAQVNNERRDLLERDIVTKWEEFVQDDALMMRVRMVVATARK